MEIHLLDTSFVSNLWVPTRAGHAEAQRWMSSRPVEDRHLISTVTLGELELGANLASRDHGGNLPSNIQQALKNARKHPLLEPTRHTSTAYADIKAAVARRYLPKKMAKKKGRALGFPEQWIDEVTGASLRINENDFWICAQAVERNLLLVAFDDHMEAVKAVVTDLRLERLRDQAVPPSPAPRSVT